MSTSEYAQRIRPRRIDCAQGNKCRMRFYNILPKGNLKKNRTRIKNGEIPIPFRIHPFPLHLIIHGIPSGILFAFVSIHNASVAHDATVFRTTAFLLHQKGYLHMSIIAYPAINLSHTKTRRSDKEDEKEKKGNRTVSVSFHICKYKPYMKKDMVSYNF